MIVSPSGCFGVDRRIGKLGQRLVGLLLLGQRLVEQLDRILHAELGSPGLQRAVAGNLIVLDRLSRREQAGVEGGCRPCTRP